MKHARQILVPLMVSAGVMLGLTGNAFANETADNIINANSVGGTAGYMLKRLNAGVLDSRNPDAVFYPASSIKVLEHLAAMRLVEEGKMHLDNTILQICSDKTNCTDKRNVDSGCTVIANDLRNALSVMMVNSGNRTTNAVQEFVGLHEYLSIFNSSALGRSYMNFLGQDLIGYSQNMALNHKFACGNVANNPANSATLRDFSKLYEAIGSREDIISVGTRLQMKTLMLNENNGFFTGKLSAIITEEAASLGKTSIADDFSAGVRMIYKGGSLPSGYLSVAGLIQLPINNGTGKRIYSFSSYIEDADIVISGTQNDVAAAILRPVIRSALQSWNTFALPGGGYISAGDTLGKLNAIIIDLPDDSSRAILDEAITEMKQVQSLLARHLPDNRAATQGLVNTVGALEKLTRYDTEGNIRDAARDMVVLSAHLTDNAIASAAGEGLSPKLEVLVEGLEKTRQSAYRSYYGDDLFSAAKLYADATSQAVVLLEGEAATGCAAYSESRACPEHATATVGF